MSTGGVSTTEYLDGFQYNNFILQFFSHPEGYVLNTPDRNGDPSYDYVYQYKDHLGNIRLNFVHARGENGFHLRVLEENHYYPFGLKHENYNVEKKRVTWEPTMSIVGPVQTIIHEKRVRQTNNSGYQYKYNGKEWQDELGLNFYDYHARNYDPAIGRWMNMDALSEKYFDNSTYTYVINNPLLFTDPDGMEIKGVNKESAESFHEDINDVFADAKFDAFRALITRGKKNNTKKFDKIDIKKFNDATKDLEGDDKLLAEILVGAINSDREFVVEYIDDEKSTLSTDGQENLKNDMERSYGTRPEQKLTGFNLIKIDSEGLSVPTKNGSHNFIVRYGNHLEGKRSLTSFHEVLGHGTAHAKGMTGNANHDNAIKLENLTRRILNIKTMRDGTNPKHADGHKVLNNTGNPIKL